MCAGPQRVSTFLIALAFLVPTTAARAAGTITGVIRNEQNQPEPFASVLIHGTSIGALTDAEGRFRIRSVPDGTWTIRILKMGYETIE